MIWHVFIVKDQKLFFPLLNRRQRLTFHKLLYKLKAFFLPSWLVVQAETVLPSLYFLWKLARPESIYQQVLVPFFRQMSWPTLLRQYREERHHSEESSASDGRSQAGLDVLPITQAPPQHGSWLVLGMHRGAPAPLGELLQPARSCGKKQEVGSWPLWWFPCAGCGGPSSQNFQFTFFSFCVNFQSQVQLSEPLKVKQTELSDKLRCASGSQHVSFLTSICRVLASEVCDKKMSLLMNSFWLLLLGGCAEEEEGGGSAGCGSWVYHSHYWNLPGDLEITWK